MERAQFVLLRDIPAKRISSDIRFVRKQSLTPVLIAEGILIENPSGVELILSITLNPVVGSKTLNVHVPGVGPICRLDVDGAAHRPAGRSHKHSLQTEQCPARNLPDGVIDRPDLAGASIADVFAEFCRMANITHTGQLKLPEAGA